MEVQTYIGNLQQIMQAAPQVSNIMAGASEVRIFFYKSFNQKSSSGTHLNIWGFQTE